MAEPLSYYCRDCFQLTHDSRTKEARDLGLSLKCPNCGGICDPTAKEVARLENVRYAASCQAFYALRKHYIHPDDGVPFSGQELPSDVDKNS